MYRKVKILFFIGNLSSGGKERRLIELLTYLEKDGRFDCLMVLTQEVIDYDSFLELRIPYKILGKNLRKNDPSLFTKFYKICREYQPDLIHSWGQKQSFYTLPAVILQKIPLVNSQITSAPPPHKIKWTDRLIDKINFKFSSVILSNSKAGIKSFNPPMEKSKVIYNGINLKRFDNLPSTDEIKKKYKIKTPFAVVMTASFSRNKNYAFYVETAELVTRELKNVTFIGVGGTLFSDTSFHRLSEKNKNPRIILMDAIQDVEALVNACDIGVLFSDAKNHGEGISNSVMEYMSLSKPVIANNAGGTCELVKNQINGYLLNQESPEEVKSLIVDLLNNADKREYFGSQSKRIIDNHFLLDKMGKLFVEAYQEVLQKQSQKLISTQNPFTQDENIIC